MTLQWIDRTAGVAYVSLRNRLWAFHEFLNAVEQLIAHPDWRPGMPVVEDIRELTCPIPPNCVEEWRAYVAERGPMLDGCRWAVVRRDTDSPMVSVLEAAARDAAPHGVLLEQFSNMVDAHLWVGSATVRCTAQSGT